MADDAPLVSFALTSDWGLEFQVSSWIVLGGLLVVLATLVITRRNHFRRIKDFEIDGADFGFGDLKIKMKPNDTDRQIAYAIWVELSTRKIGLPIDLQDDVIDQIYDSWYAFFGITRDLVRTIPVSRARRESTSQIIHFAIEVLNQGLRPHLTRWQARYRTWWQAQAGTAAGKSPQEMQKEFPEFAALREDLLRVNRKLIAYRARMYELAMG